MKSNDFKGISTVAKGLTATGSKRKLFAQELQSFGAAIHELISSQNLDDEIQVQKIVIYINEMVELHQVLSAQEERSGDDIRDICERYVCLFRAFKEYTKCKDNFKKATDELESAKKKKENEQSKPTYEKNQPKLDAAIDKAKSIATDALEKLKEATKEFILQKEKFNIFKIRRATEGWVRYSTSHVSTCEKESELLGKIATELKLLSEKQYSENNFQDEEYPQQVAQEISSQPLYDDFE
ncbi:hypothetical protein GPJ56_002959 [Histomonas meleagridis]|uniref:uncharacterized protein n=1 Tax=Histomonas meleagridis TaxID=135588 RepID=UPI00355A38D9|nr:hypothetical protein GPJ56_002959 [Histomonas meleagridis]KAH0796618.1 hypothetical protein GO595_010511 [Histomonas meleagridis]